MDIEVVVSHHIEAGDPDADGFGDLTYEFDLVRYVTDDLVLVVRVYADEEATEAQMLRFEDGEGTALRGVTRDDLGSPIVRVARAHLLRGGATSVRRVTADGYEDVPLVTSNDTPAPGEAPDAGVDDA